MSKLDRLLWAPIRAPELGISLICIVASAGAHAFNAPQSAVVFLFVGAAAWMALKPPRLKMEGYGTLRPNQQVPICSPQGAIQIEGGRFVDDTGRTLLLRGVNLSGASKLPALPVSASSTHIPLSDSTFYDHANVSFVGRPFPLEQADEHFSRLRLWGLTFIRLLVTWEAVEHTGPGQYDSEFLEYLLALVRRAAAHGITVFIDPHMDCWSRFTGGDGAPGWTLEAVGLDLCALHDSGVAFLQQKIEGRMPTMIWPSNYLKMGAATMYSLFFGGDDFAPGCKIEGEPVQQYLQRHFIGAMMQVAQVLRDEPNVAGFDSLNEPSAGFIGAKDLRRAADFKTGENANSWEQMQAASGFSVRVKYYRPPFIPRGSRVINPQCLRAWAKSKSCVWQQAGVWRLSADGEPQLLKPDFFAFRPDGSPVNVAVDYVIPLWEKMLTGLRQVQRGGGAPKYILFAELHNDLNRIDTSEVPSEIALSISELPAPRSALLFGASDLAFAPHWYDGLTLFFKAFRPWWSVDLNSGLPVLGRRAARCACAKYISRILAQGPGMPGGGVPMLIGETGIPFDIGGRGAKNADPNLQVLALELTMRSLEDSLASFTLWNYTPDNSLALGDRWNGEDLSVFTEDLRASPHDLHSGGRALPALVRPYARKVAGALLEMTFSVTDARRRFRFRFRHEEGVTAPTEVFVPHFQYPDGISVGVSDGTWTHDAQLQTLYYSHSQAQEEHTIDIELP